MTDRLEPEWAQPREAPMPTPELDAALAKLQADIGKNTLSVEEARSVLSASSPREAPPKTEPPVSPEDAQRKAWVEMVRTAKLRDTKHDAALVHWAKSSQNIPALVLHLPPVRTVAQALLELAIAAKLANDLWLTVAGYAAIHLGDRRNEFEVIREVEFTPEFQYPAVGWIGFGSCAWGTNWS